MARNHWFELKGWIGLKQQHYLSRVVWIGAGDRNIEQTLNKLSEQFKSDHPKVITKVTWEVFWSSEDYSGSVAKLVDAPDSKSGD